MAYLPFGDDSIVSEVFIVIQGKVVLPRNSTHRAFQLAMQPGYGFILYTVPTPSGPGPPTVVP